MQAGFQLPANTTSHLLCFLRSLSLSTIQPKSGSVNSMLRASSLLGQRFASAFPCNDDARPRGPQLPARCSASGGFIISSAVPRLRLLCRRHKQMPLSPPFSTRQPLSPDFCRRLRQTVRRPRRTKIMLCISCRTSCITSHFTRHTSHVTLLTSHVTRHTSHVSYSFLQPRRVGAHADGFCYLRLSSLHCSSSSSSSGSGSRAIITILPSEFYFICRFFRF
jgi:hypothetical protein